MENGKQSAFACPPTYNPNNGVHNGDGSFGLTKREYFAAMAMQGLLSNHEAMVFFSKSEDKSLSSTSVALADALLDELDKTK